MIHIVNSFTVPYTAVDWAGKPAQGAKGCVVIKNALLYKHTRNKTVKWKQASPETCKCTHMWYWIFIGTLGLALEFEHDHPGRITRKWQPELVRKRRSHLDNRKLNWCCRVQRETLHRKWAHLHTGMSQMCKLRVFWCTHKHCRLGQTPAVYGKAKNWAGARSATCVLHVMPPETARESQNYTSYFEEDTTFKKCFLCHPSHRNGASIKLQREKYPYEKKRKKVQSKPHFFPERVLTWESQMVWYKSVDSSADAHNCPVTSKHHSKQKPCSQQKLPVLSKEY